MATSVLQSLIQRIFRTADMKDKLYSRWLNTSLPFSRPFITIARDPGSGGAPIGKEVARRLGFEFYDREIIEEIAKSARLRKEILHKIDEKGRTAIQDFIQGVVNPNYVSDVTYVKHMAKVLVSMAYKGNVVILGRGACLLTPRDRGLHVRITAPLSVRINRAIEFEQVTPSRAREIVRDVGKDRRDFVKQYFGEDIRNSDCYDLILNTQHLEVEDSVEIILKAFEKKLGKRMMY